MMGQAMPEGKENNNTCPRVCTRRHISSLRKTIFENVAAQRMTQHLRAGKHPPSCESVLN